jgi:hypothetical protein
LRGARRVAGTVSVVTDSVSCSVCGRTILQGERTRAYVTPEGDQRPVCELCRSRAEGLGWIWAEVADEQRRPPERRRRGALTAFLRRRNERGSGDEAGDGGDAMAGDRDGDAAPQPPQRDPDPAARGAGVGRAGIVREPGTRLERAVARFNGSDHARTVSGLSRTLGAPLVSVGAAAGSPSEVRLTVAWELSWYQWGVDLAEPARAVYEIDKGFEVSDIDAAARQWNAHVGDDGSVRLGAAPATTESEPARTET